MFYGTVNAVSSVVSQFQDKTYPWGQVSSVKHVWRWHKCCKLRDYRANSKPGRRLWCENTTQILSNWTVLRPEVMNSIKLSCQTNTICRTWSCQWQNQKCNLKIQKIRSEKLSVISWWDQNCSIYTQIDFWPLIVTVVMSVCPPVGHFFFHFRGGFALLWLGTNLFVHRESKRRLILVQIWLAWRPRRWQPGRRRTRLSGSPSFPKRLHPHLHLPCLRWDPNEDPIECRWMIWIRWNRWDDLDEME